MVSEKRGHFQPENVSVFMKIGVIYSLKVCEKGSFLKVENTDRLHTLH